MSKRRASLSLSRIATTDNPGAAEQGGLGGSAYGMLIANKRHPEQGPCGRRAD